MRSRNPPAELRQLLGDERLQRFNDYRDNSQERRIVANLRGVASDAVHISDKQAERLVEVLGDERRKFLKEFEQRGAEYSGLNSGLGSLYYSSTAQSAEQRVAEASEFQRRQRERAAEVLTPQQLVKYKASLEARNGSGMRRGRVWIDDGEGGAKLVDIVLGITDGANTEVISGDLHEGDAVIVGVGNQTTTAAQPRRRGLPGFGR